MFGMQRGKRWIARLFVFGSVLFLVAILAEGAAWAQKPNTTLAIIVEGAPPSLRGAIGNELPSPWTQVDATAVAAAVKKRQLSKNMKALEDPATTGQYTSKVSLVAGDVGARAVLTVVESTKKTDRKAHVVLVADSGEVVVDTTVALAAPADDGPTIAKAFVDKLEPLTHPAAAKPEPTPPVAPTATPAETPKPEATAKPATPNPPAKDTPAAAPPAQPDGPEPPPMFVGTVALQLANRHLDLRGVRFSNPIQYDSGFVLTPALAIAFFPGTNSGSKVLEDLGLIGDLQLGFPKNASWTRFDIGLQYRFWLKREWKGVMIAPSVSYGQESFAVDNPGETKPPVAYKLVRPRVDARIPIWKIAVLAGAGFLVSLDSGEFADKFRDATVLGWEGDIAIAVPIMKALEIRAGFAYRRIIYWFSPETGDPNFARGAHDVTFRPDIGVTAHF